MGNELAALDGTEGDDGGDSGGGGGSGGGGSNGGEGGSGGGDGGSGGGVGVGTSQEASVSLLEVQRPDHRLWSLQMEKLVRVVRNAQTVALAPLPVSMYRFGPLVASLL